MKINLIASLSLIAIALTATTFAPAQASNADLRNQLAMQYYMQNQAAAAMSNSALNPAYSAQYASPYAASYAPALAATSMTGTTPLLSGAVSLTPSYSSAAPMYGAVSPAYGAIGQNYGACGSMPSYGSLMPSSVMPSYAASQAYGALPTSAYSALPTASYGALTSPYTTNNYALQSAIAPKMNNLNMQQAKLQAQLATTYNNPWQAAKIENKLAKVQAEETSLATTGSPYLYSGGLLNSFRSMWPL